MMMISFARGGNDVGTSITQYRYGCAVFPSSLILHMLMCSSEPSEQGTVRTVVPNTCTRK